MYVATITAIRADGSSFQFTRTYKDLPAVWREVQLLRDCPNRHNARIVVDIAIPSPVLCN